MSFFTEKPCGSWYNRRYLGLLIDFPFNLTPNILESDDVCSKYDSEVAYEALKAAHNFLTEIAYEVLQINNNEGIKCQLIWALLHFSELKEESNGYCFNFQKTKLYIINLDTGKKVSWGWIPKNYALSFQLMSENGCHVNYFKDGNPVANFKSCDSGRFYFDNNLTALGLSLFFKKLIQKRWYQKYDIGGRYSTNTHVTTNSCKEVFDRNDMRIFCCDGRLEYDIDELLAGYNDELKRSFRKIYNFVKEKYPDCMPYISIGVVCSATFCVDEKHRMIGQINFGKNENHFDAYIALTGKEMETMLEDIDSFDEKAVMLFLHDINCKCNLCKNKIGELVYHGKKYNQIYKNTENRFLIENENDADLAIKCIEIKAVCNMNTRL